MGNSSSRPPPVRSTGVVRPAGGVSAIAAPMDAVTACRVKNVELSQLHTDVTKKQNEIDTCDPADANRRRTDAKLKEYNSYVIEKEKTLKNLESSIQNSLSTINSVNAATKPTRTYINKLASELDVLDRSKMNFEQSERTQRRNFLDSSPQDGVSGILGIRTDDDKLLLAFWIIYGIAIFVITAALLEVYGSELSTMQKIQIGGVVLTFCYGLAYYGITVYG